MQRKITTRGVLIGALIVTLLGLGYYSVENAQAQDARPAQSTSQGVSPNQNGERGEQGEKPGQPDKDSDGD